MKRLIVCAAIAAVAVLAGCGKSSNVTIRSAAVSNAPAAGAVLIKAGTTFNGKLQNEISSKTSRNGDAFRLVEQDTMFYKNPALHGIVVEGHLEGISRAGLGKKPAMTIVFDDVRMPDGTKAPISVRILNMGAFDAKSHRLRTIGLMIGGAVAGHMAAERAGKKHGGLLGAASGYVLSQELKSDIDVKRGTIVQIKFLKNVTT